MLFRRSLALALVSALFASCSVAPTRPDYWALEGASSKPANLHAKRVLSQSEPPEDAMLTQHSRAAYALALLEDPDQYALDKYYFNQLGRVLRNDPPLKKMSDRYLLAKLLHLRLLGRAAEAEVLHETYRKAHPGYSWSYATPEPAAAVAQPELHPTLARALESTALWNLVAANEWLTKASADNAHFTDRAWIGGVIAHKGGSLSAAEAMLEQAVAAGTRRPEAFALLGQIAENRGNHALAEFFHAQALRLHPYHEEAVLGLTRARHHLLGKDAALSWLRHGQKQLPDNYALWLALGDEHSRNLSFIEARAAYTRAFRANPRAYSAYLRTGDLARLEAASAADYDTKRERYGFALSMYELHSHLFPKSPEARFRQAELWFDARDLDRAERAYKDGLALAPYWPDAHLRLAQIARHFGRTEEAKALLEKEIAVSPRPDYAFVEKGNMAMAAKDFDLASRCFSEAYRLNPRNSDALFGDGVVKHLAGEYEEALALFRHTLAEDPLKMDVHWQIGLIYQKLGRREEARHAFQVYKTFSREPASVRRADDKIEQLQ